MFPFSAQVLRRDNHRHALRCLLAPDSERPPLQRPPAGTPKYDEPPRDTRLSVGGPGPPTRRAEGACTRLRRMLFLVLRLQEAWHFPPNSTVTFWTGACVHTAQCGEVTRGHTERRMIVVRLPPGPDRLQLWRGVLVKAPSSTAGREYTVAVQPSALLLDADEAHFPFCSELSSCAGEPTDVRITRLGSVLVVCKMFSVLTAAQRHLLKRDADRVKHDNPDPPSAPRQPFPQWDPEEEVAHPPCAICFEAVVDPCALSCGHAYCAGCVERARLDGRCAKCRASVVGPILRLFF